MMERKKLFCRFFEIGVVRGEVQNCHAGELCVAVEERTVRAFVKSYFLEADSVRPFKRYWKAEEPEYFRELNREQFLWGVSEIVLGLENYLVLAPVKEEELQIRKRVLCSSLLVVVFFDHSSELCRRHISSRIKTPLHTCPRPLHVHSYFTIIYIFILKTHKNTVAVCPRSFVFYNHIHLHIENT